MNKVSKCLKKCAKYDDRKNLAILCWKMQLRAKTRAHVRARDFFAKCLKWPETYAKLIWNEFEHFKILMRAYVRVEVRARNLLTFLVDLWPEVDVYQIWLIFDDSLSRYDNDLIFTKWRLDDVTMT